jgi:hypothetical protein
MLVEWLPRGITVNDVQPDQSKSTSTGRPGAFAGALKQFQCLLQPDYDA